MDGNQQRKTPNIDKFSDKGMVFENAYCPAPLYSLFRQVKFYMQSNKWVMNLKGENVPIN